MEFIARKTKNHRQDVVRHFTKKDLERQLRLAEVNHCLSFEQVSDRLLVRGTRIDYMEAKQVQPDEVETILYFPDEVKLLGIATVAIGILLIIVNIWRRRRHGKRQKKRRYRRHT